MLKRTIPAVDAALSPQHGVSRLGQPLSYNRAPAADIAPWIGGLYATIIDAPDDYVLDCGIVADASVFRFQLRGNWSATTPDGTHSLGRSAVFFGPQSRLMPITVRGAFTSIGFSLRPGSGPALIGQPTAVVLDRMFDCGEMGLPGAHALDQLDRAGSPEQCLLYLEDLIRRIIGEKGGRLPDPVTARFETAALADPTFAVADFAAECGITTRSLERIIARDFGMSPKQVLRRARALDMAAHLRGVADEGEAAELALRYYDQSHLNREFTQIFGMTPRQFVQRPQPILTLALESRQARRLEAIKRLEPGGVRPWE
ncbi:AraC family transcriptional regulator [Novosphingobium sp. TH158]|uniref:helix-turn-helix domain-containing protein n=1 Tax=Novosphingobium sp. TH158 TaxID=2067455 RepID=UPI000C7B7FDA|nr:AraC family transcriptional regulator [Novosphingobium sp. TH158]PLK26919.1 AraC family transcriptional regulator [Novosphingobium sp. TH158]